MADPLERDSLFQLNLLIWASLPQPPGAPVTPAVHNAGYVLWALEQPLDAGLAELARLRASGPQINPNPTADGVLRELRSDTYVLIECKPGSFDVGSGRAPQARGLIAAGGNAASRLGLGRTASAEACYLVPLDEAPSMDATLVALAGEVAGQGFTACSTGSLGVAVKPDGAYLGLTSQPLGAARLPRLLIPDERVVQVPPGQDPRPLYVLPWIPDAPDSTDLTAFREKLRAHVLAWLGRAPTGGEVVIAFDELLDEVTRGVFRLWRDRSSLRGRVFPAVGRLMDLLLGSDGRVLIRQSEVRLSLHAETDREELMERVRTAGLPANALEGLQLPLEEEN